MLVGLVLLIQGFSVTADSALEQSVVKVIDGDTLILADGQHVRLLGINTPEVARKGKRGEPGGLAASQWLKRRTEGHRIRLQTGQEKHDRYGRLLAHIFDKDGTHINRELVAAGLATVSIIPPNLGYTEVLLAAQRQARIAGKGLWGMDRYRRQTLQEIDLDKAQGWQRLLVRPRALSGDAKSSRLVINDRFYLRVPREHLANFPELDAYVGQLLEVRGWISRYRGQHYLLVRHPSALILADDL